MQTLIFYASEDWTVADLFRFFQQLNILYNRLYVTNSLRDVVSSVEDMGDEKRLDRLLLNSLAAVPEEHQLHISSLEIHSPAVFNLKGIGEIIEQIREWIKDSQYRKEIENQQLLDKADHDKKMQAIQRQEAKVEVFSKKVIALKKIGYTEKQIQRFVEPSDRVAEFMKLKEITLTENE